MTSQQPTIFRLREVHQKKIYTYSLVLRQDRVLEELLEYIPAPPKRKSSKLLFSRKWDERTEKHIWKNGEDFAGSHTQLQASLQEKELFLTLLVKSLEVPVIKPIIVGLTQLTWSVLSVHTFLDERAESFRC